MFFRLATLVSMALFYSLMLPAQNYRSFDGSGNNLTHHEWGSVSEPLLIITGLEYEDNVGTPTGTNRPNPRHISNVLFRQDSIIPDYMHLSDFCWVFGQFIDHDITLSPESHSEPLMIDVPIGDPWFDPFSTGQVKIPMLRTQPAASTGTDQNNPRNAFNAISAYIDASAIYGSDEQTANWLRSYNSGKLKTSQGNLLPFNTITGQLDSDIDPNAPEMANPVGLTDKYFVSGDVRINENPLLTAFHTIFMREHNRQCDIFRNLQPNWRDEQIYQAARKRVGAIIQAIVYEEWLPAMGVDIAPYSGYKNDVNAQISNVFAAAAYRMGHTLLNGNIMRLDNDGLVIPEGNLQLRDAYFNPMEVVNVGGIEPYLKGMGAQEQQRFDAKLLDDVRNFLFGPPGAGGLDLAAININRGRERGLPDYNSIREMVGLDRANSFGEITSDPDLMQVLESLYGDVDDIDPWVGMLTEDRMSDALFGPTVMKIVETQFQALRDGDRYYYENDPTISAAEKQAIKNTRLYDIIMRNSDVTIMQLNVFHAMPHGEICNAQFDFADIFGSVFTEDGEMVENVSMDLINNGIMLQSTVVDSDGSYLFNDAETCESYSVDLDKDDQAKNGVTTLDLVLIAKHILNIQKLDSPYKILAADVNNSGNVSTLDMIALRKVILSTADQFPFGKTWRFVYADYPFPNPDDPWSGGSPFVDPLEKIESDTEVDFIAIKLGDVNNSADLSTIVSVDDRSAQSRTSIEMENIFVEKDMDLDIPVEFSVNVPIAALQFGLNWDVDKLDLRSVSSPSLSDFTSANYLIDHENGRLAISWNNELSAVERVSITMKIRALKDFEIRNVFTIDENIVAPLAWDENLKAYALELNNRTTVAHSNLSLESYPNPFADNTTLSYNLPAAAEVDVQVYDHNGKMVFGEKTMGAEGNNTYHLTESIFSQAGIYYVKIISASGSLNTSIIRI